MALSGGRSWEIVGSGVSGVGIEVDGEGARNWSEGNSSTELSSDELVRKNEVNKLLVRQNTRLDAVEANEGCAVDGDKADIIETAWRLLLSTSKVFREGSFDRSTIGEVLQGVDADLLLGLGNNWSSCNILLGNSLCSS